MKKEDLFTQEFYASDKEVNHLKIMFDGSCGPVNPNGNVGYGYALFDEDSGDVLCEGWGYVLYDGSFQTSNNFAEWGAIRLALEHLVSSGYSYNKLSICGDSMLVIRQVEGKWKIKGGSYSPIARRTLKDFGAIIKGAEVYHVGRDDNDYCDELSNRYISYLSTFGVETGGKFKLKNKRNEKSTDEGRV